MMSVSTSPATAPSWVIYVECDGVSVYAGVQRWTGDLAEARRFSERNARNGANNLRLTGKLSKSRIIRVTTVQAAKRGAVLVRRVRSTKLLVGLYAPGVFESDERAKWMVVCEPHGGCIGGATRAQAEMLMSIPEQWCPTCQESPENTR